jgi:hypothetical protein
MVHKGMHMNFEPSERYVCSFHGLWLWKTYCSICKLFEREPEKFCVYCKGFLKTVRMKLPWSQPPQNFLTDEKAIRLDA